MKKFFDYIMRKPECLTYLVLVCSLLALIFVHIASILAICLLIICGLISLIEVVLYLKLGKIDTWSCIVALCAFSAAFYLFTTM